MALQSRAPAILLTRPLAQSRRFARSLRAAHESPLHILISPLMQVAFFAPAMPATPPRGLIFSSETAVAAYARLPDRPVCPAWCIGQRTEKAARMAGLETVFCAPDAASLLSHIITQQPAGAFLHMRGEDSHGDVAATLTRAGIPTAEVIVYAQRPAPLTKGASRVLLQKTALIVPLFSARSAKLFCDAAPLHPQIRFAALSAAVAAAIPPDHAGRIVISARPDAAAMLESVRSLLWEPSLA